jgi:hypothetical protein
MDERGDLSTKDINELITGSRFGVVPYGSHVNETPEQRADDIADGKPVSPTTARPELEWESLLNGDANRVEPPLERVAFDLLDPGAKNISSSGSIAGSNGELDSAEHAADIKSEEFDTIPWNITDVACPVCMGTGYVGGFLLEGGWRCVLPVNNSYCKSDGALDTTMRPLRMVNAQSITWDNVVLPRNARLLDSNILWDGIRPAHDVVSFMIDGVPCTRESEILKFFDGAAHSITSVFTDHGSATHLELQVALNKEPTLVEFPKMNFNSDVAKLNRTDEVAVFFSPATPSVSDKDLIAVPFATDDSGGAIFQIVSGGDWTDKNRRMLGLEAQARVIQPQELYMLLPNRFKKNAVSTYMTRGNDRGIRRV